MLEGSRVESVPFLDLKRGYEIYGKEIEEAVLEVLRSGRYLNGEKTRLAEETLAEFLGARFAIGVSSGTEALYLILKALELPLDSYVLLPSFTFVATAEVVVRAGLVPYFVDVEEDTYNLSPQALEEAYQKLSAQGKRVSAVIGVSLFGIPARMEEISAFCRERGLFLIEDICQSFGAGLNGKKVGTFGIASATSFYPSKPLSTCGDGGMVFTSDEALARKIRVLKEHGQTAPYYYEYSGINGRIDEIHSAILLVKFPYFKKELELRKRLASLYFEALGEVEEIRLPVIPEGASPSYSLFTIRAEKRDALRDYLKAQGIHTGIYYSLPLHLQPVYKKYGFKIGDLPATERLAKEVLSLPFFPYMKDEEVFYVAQKIKEFYRGK